MARKVYCNNTRCKHHCGKDGCGATVKIGDSGRCNSFEKGFVYYFHIVWDELGNGNYIDAVRLDEDLRIGLFYVMSVYHLGFSEKEWGLCRFIFLQDGENGEPMTYEQIIEKGMDKDLFDKLYEEFEAGKLPEIKKEKAKVETQPFGWLSPTGKFTEGDFCEHEEVAEEIVNKNGFIEEYEKWQEDSLTLLCRDFLCEVKGYCLIHNPSGVGGYIVSHQKPLTKKQKEFLYGYFIDMGDKFKAEQYLD